MRRSPLVVCCVGFLLSAALLPAAEWRAITPAELALKQPKTDPNADAEALFRDVRILNQQPSFGYARDTRTEYIRLKIFTERGKEKYGSVTIPYFDQATISGVEGRTIKPNGTVIELKKDAVFYKTVVRKSGVQEKAVTFAMPDVEPGDIIEYRWYEDMGDVIYRYVPLDVQSAFPTDQVTFHVKVDVGQWITMPEMHMLGFRCSGKLQPESNGFESVTLHNIPAFHEEPYMPPDDSLKQWILLYFEENSHAGGNPDKYWKDEGRQIYRSYHLRIKVNDEIRKIAAQAIAGAASDDEKLARLVEYCRKNLKDIHGDQIALKQREQAKQQWNTAAILRQQAGTQKDLRLVFIALAQAAGFEARLAEMCSRDVDFFDPRVTSAFFLNTEAVAVKVDGTWKFYDVMDPSIAPGQLPWPEQDVKALVTDSKEPEFVATPMLGVKETMIQHGGAFKLSAGGTLDGVAHEFLWGNEAARWRARFGLKNEAEREQVLRRELKQRFADFDLSEVRFSDSPDSSKPVGIYYHIVVHNYAQHTARRIFLVPAYFESGNGARFVDTVRKQPIYFDYPWSASDSVEIQLPEGYQLDHADAPASFGFPPVGTYSTKMFITNTNKLLYTRQFVFGANFGILFPATAYDELKKIFDTIHTEDGHTIALKAETQASAQVH